MDHSALTASVNLQRRTQGRGNFCWPGDRLSGSRSPVSAPCRSAEAGVPRAIRAVAPVCSGAPGTGRISTAKIAGGPDRREECGRASWSRIEERWRLGKLWWLLVADKLWQEQPSHAKVQPGASPATSRLLPLGEWPWRAEKIWDPQLKVHVSPLAENIHLESTSTTPRTSQPTWASLLRGPRQKHGGDCGECTSPLKHVRTNGN
jgi:hypothetical protein